MLDIFVRIINLHGHVSRLATAFFQERGQLLLKKHLEVLIAPISKPHLNAIIHLVVTRVRFIDNASAVNVVSRINRLSQKTQYKSFPENGKSVVILLYSSPEQSKRTCKHTHPAASVLIMRIFVLGLDSLLENALSNDLKLTEPSHSLHGTFEELHRAFDRLSAQSPSRNHHKIHRYALQVLLAPTL